MSSAGRVVVIGAGAAGCFAALAARGAIEPDGTPRRPSPDAPDVELVDGQQRPGRKILISGGGRCNVTNEHVGPDDFSTADPHPLRTMLAEFGARATARWFAASGVPLAPEPMGKLFPADGRVARDVLGALHAALDDASVQTRYGTPVETITRTGDGTWSVDGRHADRVVLATGGRSVPATGSTGFGLDLAHALGLTTVPSVPALVALHGTVDERLAGLSLPAVVTVAALDGRVHRRAAGSLLFTHRGVSGPAALDVAEAIERHGADAVRVTADCWSLLDRDGPFGPWLGAPKLPGACLADAPPPVDVGAVDTELVTLLGRAAGGATVSSTLRDRLPRRLVEVLVGADGDVPAASVPRDVRRRLAHDVARFELRVTGTAGYAKAEVTAGGIRLSALDRRTLAVTGQPGLYACGEVCDVTGRLGGFNFQWAWTSGFLAGRGAAASIA